MFTRDDGSRIAGKLGAEASTGRKHDVVKICFNGVVVATFGLRRGSGELPHDYIPRQIHLTYSECRQLVDCTLTPGRYFELLRARGKLPPATPSPGPT